MNPTNHHFLLREFSKYAAFFLENPPVLKRLLDQYFFQLREGNLPYLSLYPEMELEKEIHHSLLHFLEEAVAANALANAREAHTHRKAGYLPGIPGNKLQVKDIVRVYSIRKQLFLDFLPEFTSDTSKWFKIIKELEQFYSWQEEEFFATFLESKQEELAREKELKVSIVNHSVNGVFAFDLHHIITEWNVLLEGWTGIKRRDAVGKNLFTILPYRQESREAQAIYKVLNAEPVFLSETQFHFRKGFFEANLVPLFDEDKRITGGVCIIHEVTHRKEAEIKLKKANEELFQKGKELDQTINQLRSTKKKLIKRESRLKEAQTIAKVGSWDWKVKKDQMVFSEELKHLLNYDQKEIKPGLSTYLQSVHPEDKGKVNKQFDQILLDQIPFTIEHRLLFPDSPTEERWVQLKGQLQQDPLRVRGTCLDITEIKTRERELEEMQYFLEQVVDSVPNIIFLLDLKRNTYLYTNQEAFEILGYHSEEIIGKQDFLFQIIHPDDAETIKEQEKFYKQLGPDEFIEIHVRLLHKDGNWRWFRSKTKIFRYRENGEPSIILGISEDITDAKEIEEQLIKARDYYLQILESFPALIWRSGLDGKCNYFNKGWLEFTGRSLQEEMGDGWTDGVHPEDLEFCYKTYSLAFQKQEPFVMEYRLKRKDDQYRYIVDYGNPINDLDGNFFGFVGACFDIQDRKDHHNLLNDKNNELAETLQELFKAEEQLKEVNQLLEKRVEERTRELANRENFLNSILDQSPVSTWIADKEGTQIRVNQAYSNLFGIKDSAAGTKEYNILKDEQLKNSSFYPDLVAVFKEGKVARFEGEYLLKSEENSGLKSEKAIYVSTTVFPIKNSVGEVTHAVIKTEDNTERRNAEKALLQREEQLRLITDSVPVFISYVDQELRYQFVNKSYEEFFKKDKKEMLGRTIWEIAGQQAIQNLLPYIEKVFKGQAQSIESHQSYGERGSLYLSINLIPHFHQGTVDGFYAMGYDMSDRIKTELEMEQLYAEAKVRNEELNRINTDLDNFIYTASHDLKSPVANLEGLLLLLEKNLDKSVEGKEKKLVEMMEVSVGKLKKTIEDLVEITKLQKEADEHSKDAISFKQLLEDVKADLDLMMVQSSAEIVEDFQVEELKYAKSYLRSILYNLLSNALKYRSPERLPKILVKTFEEGGEVVLLLKDNGLGLNSKQQKKLFTMFKRMHAHVEGTGIGLYTIKRIIENNGGRIEVRSEEGKGTEFKVYFKNGEPKEVKSGLKEILK